MNYIRVTGTFMWPWLAISDSNWNGEDRTNLRIVDNFISTVTRFDSNKYWPIRIHDIWNRLKYLSQLGYFFFQIVHFFIFSIFNKFSKYLKIFIFYNIRITSIFNRYVVKDVEWPQLPYNRNPRPQTMHVTMFMWLSQLIKCNSSFLVKIYKSGTKFQQSLPLSLFFFLGWKCIGVMKKLSRLKLPFSQENKSMWWDIS